MKQHMAHLAPAVESEGASSRQRTRAEQKKEDCWNLDSLFTNVNEWEKERKQLIVQAERFAKLSGTLGSQELLSPLQQYATIGGKSEQLYYYALLKFCEDMGDAPRQELFQLAQSVVTKISAQISFFVPELLQLPSAKLSSFLKKRQYADYHVFLQRLIRQRPHTLSIELEHQLALQSELQAIPESSFTALVDVDFTFPEITTPHGPVALTHASYQTLLRHQTQSVRKDTYTRYLETYHGHRQTLTTLYAGSIKQDMYNATVRKHNSARAAALFFDDIPETVYDNLIAIVREHLPALHRYYVLRARALQLPQLRLYDLHVPITSEAQTHYPFESAVATVVTALAPLGEEYCKELAKGLASGWVDRYENKGKRSGAFAASAYRSTPYILLNYQPRQLRSVLTLAHEAGHAMHSLYSARHNPFLHYQYSIFAAEVASTVNEQLLYAHLLRDADSTLEAFLLSEQIAEIIATLFRQTMFAEFELAAHNHLKENGSFTYPWIEQCYQQLLTDYFGDTVKIEPFDAIEALRIPHFYRPYYTYQYATGISAAITFVAHLEADPAQSTAYLDFLMAGGRYFPLEALQKANVDLTTTTPFITAIKYFQQLVDRLEKHITESRS